MIASRSGETYRLGDHVTVKLIEAAPLAGALRFEMISEGTKGRARSSAAAKPHKATKRFLPKHKPGHAKKGR